jgi:pimeloyl-ACP methyl ester carboxylesterase
MTAVTTLVLLPGLDGTDTYFAPLIAALPPSVRPLVVSYPQSGENSYAALLALVREAVSGIADCYVLGWSFSGPLALMLAAAEPARVRGVILVATFVQPPNRLLVRLRHVLGAPTVWTWRAARRMPLWLFRPRSDPFRRAKTDTWKTVSAGVLAARLRAILGVDSREALRTCPRPILYLAASRDDIVPRRNVEAITALRPSVEVVTIDGAHLALYSNPQPAAAAILAFMTRGDRVA